jgi:hypothetical protein
LIGSDKNIEVSSHILPPTHKNKEEEKSGWFIVEKKKYRVKIEDVEISLRSTYKR